MEDKSQTLKQRKNKNKTFMAPFMNGVQLPQGWSHLEEVLHFLPEIPLLTFTLHFFPETPGTDFIDLGTMKG